MMIQYKYKKSVQFFSLAPCVSTPFNGFIHNCPNFCIPLVVGKRASWCKSLLFHWSRYTKTGQKQGFGQCGWSCKTAITRRSVQRHAVEAKNF